MPKTPVTFLFDLDGTLIDHFTAIHRSYVYTLGQMGAPAQAPTLADVRKAVGGGLPNSMRRFVSEADLPRALELYRDYWDRTMLDDVVLLPGARELLEMLQARGALLAVLTNKLGSSSRLICDHLGITPFLRAVVGAEDTKWLKPQPELMAHTLGLVGATADGAVMVGDSPYDIEAAHQAGLPAWCVTTGTHDAAQLRAARADAIYPNLDAMRAALRAAPGA
jgi:phosphoglycolate phosphatase-like HAD superfamily hydrolase